MKPLDPRLVRSVRPARTFLTFTVLAGAVSTALIIAQAALLADLIVRAVAGMTLSSASRPLAWLLAVVVVRGVVAYAGEVVAARATIAVRSDLRGRLFAHLARLGPGYLAGRSTGDLTVLAGRGLDALDAYVARYLPQLALAVITPLAVVATIAYLDWRSALVLILTLPLIPIFMWLVGANAEAHTRRQWLLLARLGGHFLDVVEGLPTLRLYGRADGQARAIGEVTDEHRRVTMRTLRVAFLSSMVLELLATLATAIVAVEVGIRLLDDRLSFFTALVVLILTPEAYLPLRNVGTQFHASMEGVTTTSAVLDILDTPVPEHLARTGGRAPAARPTELVRLEQVSVTYPGRDEPALAAVDLSVDAGERIVLAGPSGSGKSTLLALIVGLVPPNTGTLTLGGVPADELDWDQWRSQITWVPQNPHLFAGSLADNMRLGRPSASDAEILTALEAVGLDDVVRSVGGLNRPLGGASGRMSTGQRQRLSLARAVIRPARLVLLDEPTAHVDPVTARSLQSVVDSLAEHAAIITVTHDPSLIGDADRLVRLDVAAMGGAR